MFRSKHRETHSLDPEVVGCQFSIVNLQHEASVLQCLLPHLRKDRDQGKRYLSHIYHVLVQFYS